VTVKFYVVGTIFVVVALVILFTSATFISTGPDKPHSKAQAPQTASGHAIGGTPTATTRPPANPSPSPVGSPTVSLPTYTTGVTGTSSAGPTGTSLTPGLPGPRPGASPLAPMPPPVVPPAGNGVVDTHTISR
jgi:hypothetical protein